MLAGTTANRQVDDTSGLRLFARASYYGGQRIGEVEYKAPNNLNTNKFSSAEIRIGYMMDVLFGKITVAEANKSIIPKSTQGE